MDRIITACVILLMWMTMTQAQTGTLAEQQFIAAASQIESGSLKFATQVKEFYKLNLYSR